MKQTLERTDNNFSLLYLNYNECLFNSISAYSHKLHSDNVYLSS